MYKIRAYYLQYCGSYAVDAGRWTPDKDEDDGQFWRIR